MSIRISELTPKGAVLSATDLLEISESTPDGFVSKSITGAEIIESIPVPEVNPRTLASVNGTNVTGTTIAISASILIPANTLTTDNTIFVNSLANKTIGSGASYLRIYTNTTNSLTGANLLAISGALTTTYYGRLFRYFYFDGTNLYVYAPNTANPIDLTQGSLTLVPFNKTVDNYILLASQNPTTASDNIGAKRSIIQIYE